LENWTAAVTKMGPLCQDYTNCAMQMCFAAIVNMLIESIVYCMITTCRLELAQVCPMSVDAFIPNI
jgi:hypothetical protein